MNTIRQNLGGNLLGSLLNCLVYGLGVGFAVSIAMMSLILLSGNAQAAVEIRPCLP